MQYIIENSFLRYGIDDNSRCISFYNKQTKHEYISSPAYIWKLIFSIGQREERPVFADGQKVDIKVTDNKITLIADRPHADDGEVDITLTICLALEGEALSVTSKIENRDDITVTELITTAAAGISSLCGNPKAEYIMWPTRYGKVIPNPSESDLSVYSGFRKYERHDYLHTDLDLLYPGGSGSMPWYDLYSKSEGLYVGSHDTSCRTVCLHAERNVATNLLSLGVCHYIFAKKGESRENAPIVYQPHNEDWRHGAHIYRNFALSSGYFTAPEIPEWARNFEGWLRVILKPHHCEINWHYSDIPSLYDGAAAAGLNTIFLLGWEKGGFARRWPDFYADDTPTSQDSGSLGTVNELKAGIDYVHSKGGKVIMFVSYFLIDHKSDFYLKEGGDQCTIKSIWGEDVPFAETYCGEATYRKLPNPPMPMYGGCPGSDKWHKKMTDLAEYCLELGADGVLYDLGGLKPYFCFAENHDHSTPDMACTSKASRFAELRKTVKSYGKDKIILQEHIVDVFNQNMDIVQGSGMNASGAKCTRPDMFRYTFPEVVMTNRELGEDESSYRDNINYTFMYGLSFDMTIYRCCGRMEDIPKYAAYMKEVIELRRKYTKYLHSGSFIGRDGFTVFADASVQARAYRAADGSIGVAIWNGGKEKAEVIIKNGNGREFNVSVAADSVDFCII